MGSPIIADFSNPDHFNSKYIPLFHSKKRYIFLMGGGGSGKSSAEAQNEVMKTYLKDNRCLAVRKVMATIKESMFAELCLVIERWGIESHFEITKSPMYIRNLVTGSDIIFRGMDDPEKIKSVSKVKRIWIEEASEFDAKDFNQLDLRLRGSGDLQIVATFNPVDEEQFLITDYWNKGETDDVMLIHSTFLDNRFVGSEFAKVMERLKVQDPRMYEIYALGKPGRRVEGQIFDNWEEIDSIPEDAKLVGHGLDFGFSNDPTGLIDVYEWNGCLILDESLYRTGMTNPDIMAHMKSEGIDPNDDIVADSSEPKSIEEIYRGGFNIRGVKKGPDSVMFGIQVMKQFKIYYTRRSGNLRKEKQNYVWKKDKNGKVLNAPVDMWNHLIDGARYFIMDKYGTIESEPQAYFL